MAKKAPKPESQFDAMKDKPEIYENLVAAEKFARTNMQQSAIALRDALGAMTRDLMEKNGITFEMLEAAPKNPKHSTDISYRLCALKRPECLAVESLGTAPFLIDTPKEFTADIEHPTPKQRDFEACDLIRLVGNRGAHADLGAGKPILTYYNLCQALRAFHKILELNYPVELPPFNPQMTRIEDYIFDETLREVPSLTSDSVSYEVLAYKKDGLRPKYYLLKIYPKAHLDELVDTRELETLTSAGNAYEHVPGMLSHATRLGAEGTNSEFMVLAYEFGKHPYPLRKCAAQIPLAGRIRICHTICACLAALHGIEEHPIYNRLLNCDSIYVNRYSPADWRAYVMFNYAKLTDVSEEDPLLTVFEPYEKARQRTGNDQILSKYLRPHTAGDAQDLNKMYEQDDVYALKLLCWDILSGSITAHAATFDELERAGLDGDALDALAQIEEQPAGTLTAAKLRDAFAAMMARA